MKYKFKNSKLWMHFKVFWRNITFLFIYFFNLRININTKLSKLFIFNWKKGIVHCVQLNYSITGANKSLNKQLLSDEIRISTSPLTTELSAKWTNFDKSYFYQNITNKKPEIHLRSIYSQNDNDGGKVCVMNGREGSRKWQ